MLDQEKWDMWKKRVEDYQASGFSAARWCRENRIPESTFWTWKQRVMGAKAAATSETKSSTPKEATPRWVAISEEEPALETAVLTIRLGAIGIEVKPGYDEKLLQHVIQTLMPLC